jgi:MFS family permease
VYALSAIAQTFGTVAVTVAVFRETDSAAWVGAVAAARLLPYLVVSPVAGVLADHLGFRRLMVASAVSRGLLCLALAVALTGAVQPVAVVALLFALTACGTPCYPAMAAAVTADVPAAELAPANALLTAVEQLAFVAGPAVGGVALVAVTPEAVLLGNAALFALVLVAALLVPAVIDLRVPAPPGDPAGRDGRDHIDGADHERRSLWSGARALRATTATHVPLLLVLAVNFLYGVTIVAVVLVADDVLGLGDGGVGGLNAALGAGGVVGLVAIPALDRARRPIGVLTVLTVLTGACLAVLGVLPWAAAAGAVLLVAGVAGVLAEVLALTAVQRAVPAREVARVFGILDALLVGAICAGSLVTSPMVHAIGLGPTLAVLGVAAPTAVVGLGLLLRPPLHRDAPVLQPARG